MEQRKKDPAGVFFYNCQKGILDAISSREESYLVQS